VNPAPTIATSQSADASSEGRGVSDPGRPSSHRLRARYRASKGSAGTAGESSERPCAACQFEGLALAEDGRRPVGDEAVEPFPAGQRLRGMWRTVFLGLVVTGVMAGCSRGGASGPLTAGTRPALSEAHVVSDRGVAGVTAQPDGTIQGRVFTTACGGPAGSSCPLRVYRGSLVFCPTMNSIGPCPSARVDSTGHYTIALRPGWHALIPAPGNGNVVEVQPRGVLVQSGQTTTVNIDGGNRMM
jgi:hypothetical protein